MKTSDPMKRTLVSTGGGIGGVGTLTYVYGLWGLILGASAALTTLTFRFWLLQTDDRTNRAIAYDKGVLLPPRPQVSGSGEPQAR